MKIVRVIWTKIERVYKRKSIQKSRVKVVEGDFPHIVLQLVSYPLDRSLAPSSSEAILCTLASADMRAAPVATASSQALSISLPISGISSWSPLMASNLDLISLSTLYHHTLVLANLPYEKLEPVPGIIPLHRGRPQILPNIPTTGPSHCIFPNLRLISRLQKLQYLLL